VFKLEGSWSEAIPQVEGGSSQQDWEEIGFVGKKATRDWEDFVCECTGGEACMAEHLIPRLGGKKVSTCQASDV